MKKILLIAIMTSGWLCKIDAQLPASGTWSGYKVSATETVILTGDIDMTGTVTVPAGTSLTISGDGHTIYTRYIKSGETAAVASFDVKGTLIINNTVIDGRNTGPVGNGPAGGGEAETNTCFTGTLHDGCAIAAADDAVVTLTGVTARNLYAETSLSPFLSMSGTSASGMNVSLDGCIITNCMSGNDNGIVNIAGNLLKATVSMNECDITYCMVKKARTGTGYGGVIKGNGSATAFLTMRGCNVRHCWGSGWGGAILWAAGKNGSVCTLEECEFTDNYARYLGGALSTEAVMKLTRCIVKDNVAGYGGGGIAAFPFSLSTVDDLTTAVGLFLLDGNVISGNRTLHVSNYDGQNVTAGTQPLDGTSVQTMTKQSTDGFNPRYTILNATDIAYPAGGGGIWVLMNKDGWDCSLEIRQGNEISGNVSAAGGGGVFLYKKKPHRAAVSGDANYAAGMERVVELNNYTNNSGVTEMSILGTISGNISTLSGGGVAVGSDKGSDGWLWPEVTVTGGIISSNQTTDGDGGGIFMPGGQFTINSGDISDNAALKGSGGGICIENGIFNVGVGAEDGFNVIGNTAAVFGGGLYVSNIAATQVDVDFTGGRFNGNTSRAGGGVAVSGYVNLTVDRSSMYGNTAINGGGIYMTGTSSANPAAMTFGQGMIYNNTATAEAALPDGTAWHGTETAVSGVGGGIFLDAWSSLSFDVNEVFGLYGNTAENAADDIFASGVGTKVVLPEVKDMNLTDFNIPAGELFWTEDYTENDTRYRDGLAGIATDINDPAHNLRYDYALYRLKRGHIAKVAAQTLTDTYTCLTLGYEIYLVTVERQGLKKGESAVFRIISSKQDPEAYIMLTLTGIDDTGTTVSRRLALPDGSWRVEEVTPWAWSYNHPDGAQSATTITDETVFRFTGSKREAVPMHHEGIDRAVMALPE